jgi:hypothetical protein
LKILFIKLKKIGDALLLTPAIAATRKKFPDATLWVWVRKGSEGILEGCDGIDRILTTSATDTYYNRMSSLLNDWSNLRSVRRLGFDAVFEFSESSRGRWLAAFSGSKLSAISSTDAIPPGWRLFYDVFRARDGSQGGLDDILGTEDVGFDALEGVVFCSGHLLEGGGMDDDVDAFHGHAEAGGVSDIADEKADGVGVEERVLGHLELFEFVAGVEDDFARAVVFEKSASESFTK